MTAARSCGRMPGEGSLLKGEQSRSLPGVIADRFSRSRVIAISLAAWSLVTAATGLVSGSGQLFALRVLLGVAECVYLPAALGLLADYHGSNTRATALGIHSGGLTFGMIAGGTAAGYIADHFGWRPSFLLLGAAGLLLAGFAAVWMFTYKLSFRNCPAFWLVKVGVLAAFQ